MATEESADDGGGERTEEPGNDAESGAESGQPEDEGVRDALEQEAERAAASFDEGLVELLAWVLDTDTRARIYVYLRANPASTSEEVAEGTGLYPSTVREALAALHEDGTVERHKRAARGAGNNPYEYTAIAPSELVGRFVEEVQTALNTVFNLDSHLGLDAASEGEPVHITVADDVQAAADPESGPHEDAGEAGPSTAGEAADSGSASADE